MAFQIDGASLNDLAFQWKEAATVLLTINDIEKHAAVAYPNQYLTSEFLKTFEDFGQFLTAEKFDQYGLFEFPAAENGRQVNGNLALSQLKIVKAGCYYNNQDCTDAVISFIVETTSIEDLAGIATSLDPNLKDVVYSKMIELSSLTADDTIFDLFVEYYRTASVKSPQEAKLVRKALSSTQKESQIETLIQLSFDEDFIRQQDAWYIFTYLGGHPGQPNMMITDYLIKDPPPLLGHF